MPCTLFSQRRRDPNKRSWPTVVLHPGSCSEILEEGYSGIETALLLTAPHLVHPSMGPTPTSLVSPLGRHEQQVVIARV